MIPSNASRIGGPVFAASPFQMMRRMQEDMDRILSQVLGGGGLPYAVEEIAQQLTPTLDISETNNEWRIDVELPGGTVDDVDVRVENRQLLIRAEIRPLDEAIQQDEGDRRFIRRERRYGLFEQVLTLPEDANADAVTCEFRNGVLSIHIPKAAQVQQRGNRIPVTDTSSRPAQITGAGGGQPQRSREAQQSRQASQPAASAGSGGEHEEDEDREPARAGSGAASGTGRNRSDGR